MSAVKAGIRVELTVTSIDNIACPNQVAIVLCTYNGAGYLQAQLDSLYAQTRLPDCVVLSDDASNDGSQALLEAAAIEFESLKVRVIRQFNPENMGYVKNFEQAFLRAEAHLIFPCDQDDVWHPRKIERMLECFEADPTLDVLHCDANLVDASGMSLGKRLFEVLEFTRSEMTAMTQGEAFDVLIRRNVVTGAAMAFRSGVLKRAMPLPGEWAHDEWIALVAALYGKVRTLDEVLLDYRQHDSNQIGVRARGVLHKVAGIAGYRKSFLARMESRYQVLTARLRAMDGVSKQRAAAVEERLIHAQSRNRHSDGLLVRGPRVARELWSGRYHRFGKGLRSALVDLFDVD